MRRKIVILFIIIITLVSLLLSACGKEEVLEDDDFESREDVGEYSWYRDRRAAFTKKIDDENYVLVLYDAKTEEETEIKEVSGKLQGIKWSNGGVYLLVQEDIEDPKKTYIIDGRDKILKDEIMTVGDVQWSPDSSKLLIGVDDEEGKGDIDLGIYYLYGSKVKVIEEANEKVDYFPKSWEDDNMMVYVEKKDGKEETKSIKFDPDTHG
ncbi:MAG TPA: hypothetical protein VK071_00280 [Tissierellales bacterium]|nr:hypothetical protein [Tissierellales bacterium]